MATVTSTVPGAGTDARQLLDNAWRLLRYHELKHGSRPEEFVFSPRQLHALVEYLRENGSLTMTSDLVKRAEIFGIPIRVVHRDVDGRIRP